MPDNEQTNAPETPVEGTSTEVASEAAAPEMSEREKIYAKYYGQTAEEKPVEQEPAEEKPVEQAVSEEKPTEENLATGTAAEKPVVPEEVLSKVAEMEALIKTQNEELERLKSLTTTEERQAAAKAAGEESGGEEKTWVDYYREGKFDEGDRALAARIDELSATKRASEAQNIMVQTVEMLEAKHRMQKFTDQVKQENPHLKNMEPIFNSAIERDIIRAKQEGKIKSHKDFADFYIERLKAYVNSANNVVKESRASGAKEATVRTQEVISESVVKPQDVSAPKAEAKPEEKGPDLPEDPLQAYIYLRRKQEALRDGVRT